MHTRRREGWLHIWALTVHRLLRFFHLDLHQLTGRLVFQTGKDKKLVTAALPKPANQFPTYHVYRLALVFGNLQVDVDSTSGSGYKIVVELPFGVLAQEVPSRLEFGPARIKDPLGRSNIRPWPRHLVDAVCAV